MTRSETTDVARSRTFPERVIVGCRVNDPGAGVIWLNSGPTVSRTRRISFDREISRFIDRFDLEGS
ncbi:MAG: hypothetical protein MPW15_10005 [Candidatus Manganitrophus sp.]|nr:hypothetical protein [Candidatus Manganitrophus sp.]